VKLISSVVPVDESRTSRTIPPSQASAVFASIDFVSQSALAAANLVASEAFKIAMRKLRRFAIHPEIFDKLFAPAPRAYFELAREGTPTTCDLGAFDIVSGGAIAQAALFTLREFRGQKRGYYH
jgi:hypothetical protein